MFTSRVFASAAVGTDLARWVSVALVAALASACTHIQNSPTVDFAEGAVARPAIAASAAAARVPTPATGSLFRTASFRPGFEDVRARMVGDTVTIQIAENVSASQTSTSTVDRKGTNSMGVTAFPMLGANSLANLSLGTNSSNAFSGAGGTSSANTFTGTITTTVREVLPNGHLIVVGDKQIGVNENVDVLRFSGTVDPRLVQPGSVVSSTQVANVRIESKGRGQQGEAQSIGWLSRFFLTFSPF